MNACTEPNHGQQRSAQPIAASPTRPRSSEGAYARVTRKLRVKSAEQVKARVAATWIDQRAKAGDRGHRYCVQAGERRVIEGPGADQEHVVEVARVAQAREEHEVVNGEDREHAVVEAVGEG